MLPPDAVWFITGCSSGLGRAFATHIAAHPTYRLVATARNPATLSYLGPSSSSAAAAAINNNNNNPQQRIVTLALDVTDSASTTTALDTALAHFGRIDVLVNNAGITAFGPAEAMPEPTMRDVMEVNFWGPMRLTRAAVRIFRDENAKAGAGNAAGAGGAGVRGGTVINVSSVGGRVAYPAHAAYHASKFALEGFSEAVAAEMEPAWGVRVMVLELGGVKSEFVGSGFKAGDDGRIAPPYSAAEGPVGAMLKALRDPRLQERCVEPGVVVRAAVEVVEGDEVPLRLVLGKDAFEAIWAKEEKNRDELCRWKDVACGIGGDAVPRDEELGVGSSGPKGMGCCRDAKHAVQAVNTIDGDV